MCVRLYLCLCEWCESGEQEIKHSHFTLIHSYTKGEQNLEGHDNILKCRRAVILYSQGLPLSVQKKVRLLILASLFSHVTLFDVL